MKRVMSLTTKNERTLKNSFEEFIRVKRLQNLAKRTVKNYEKSFRYFTEFIDENTLCSKITNNVILSYIENLQEMHKGISDISVNTYIRELRVFLYFCMERGYTQRFKISLVRAVKQPKETYADAELEKLLKKPTIKGSSFAEYRNWVLVCYLLGTANRRATVCNVKIGDIDFETHEIWLLEVKNKKPHSIPLSAFLEKTLREYLIYRKGTADDYLFCNVYGQKLTEDGLSTCIYKYNISRGVTKTGLHLFRHTFAKKWILNRGDPFRLKAILGHSTMAMVNEYVNMFGKDLQKDFDVFCPLDSMECIKRSNGHIKMK
ncbi:MAG: tyrosine-type recombinase/integrase [Oscillospiraceae bacterium]|jgi:integrase/recombinase XerD|nr:tyrosine-type recombinase/integrase [Oscillospiraceae bacterium]